MGHWQCLRDLNKLQEDWRQFVLVVLGLNSGLHMHQIYTPLLSYPRSPIKTKWNNIIIWLIWFCPVCQEKSNLSHLKKFLSHTWAFPVSSNSTQNECAQISSLGHNRHKPTLSLWLMSSRFRCSWRVTMSTWWGDSGDYFGLWRELGVISFLVFVLCDKIHMGGTVETIYHHINVSCSCEESRWMQVLISNIFPVKDTKPSQEILDRAAVR